MAITPARPGLSLQAPEPMLATPGADPCAQS